MTPQESIGAGLLIVGIWLQHARWSRQQAVRPKKTKQVNQKGKQKPPEPRKKAVKPDQSLTAPKRLSGRALFATHPTWDRCGKYTYGLDGMKTLSWGEEARLCVGAFCSIASNCQVFLGGNHHINRVTTYPFGHKHTKIFDQAEPDPTSSNGDVCIGSDVWIGSNVTIMSGVNIADGAVVAANSHVVKSVPAYGVVGGNPARLIKYRFSEDEIQRLLRAKWWEWDDGKINRHLPLMCCEDINAFLVAAENTGSASQ
jgi:acetyltransferase-like isoleucine patch superfamily enzyme